MRIRGKADVPIIGHIFKGFVKKQFMKKAVTSTAPSSFTSDTQLLPLAAQFAEALKSTGYNNFRVTSDAAPVAQLFSLGKVSLNMKTKGGFFGESLEDHADSINIWR